ncbi:hypothetical protein MLD38_021425 [Melastoma candidum]|uniref:Uncharacterized protein n=1 Tax=Melastoma candidum TaxID=119954 RepID=A0ACB9QG26_9MYRT|nr:hypothetical protein MLD38_021425 [Melastoma candidum]
MRGRWMVARGVGLPGMRVGAGFISEVDMVSQSGRAPLREGVVLPTLAEEGLGMFVVGAREGDRFGDAAAEMSRTREGQGMVGERKTLGSGACQEEPPGSRCSSRPDRRGCHSWGVWPGLGYVAKEGRPRKAGVKDNGQGEAFGTTLDLATSEMPPRLETAWAREKAGTRSWWLGWGSSVVATGDGRTVGCLPGRISATMAVGSRVPRSLATGRWWVGSLEGHRICCLGKAEAVD